jgi:hypothetical protein
VVRYRALLGGPPGESRSSEDSQSCHTFARTGRTSPLLRRDSRRVFSFWPGLTDTAIPSVNLELFTDGSRRLQEGGYWTGYAVTTVTPVVEHGWLPDHWSAQRAELHTLTKALTLADGKTANIYTDSCYTFATLHVHGAIYKERGLLTFRGKEIKDSQ